MRKLTALLLLLIFAAPTSFAASRQGELPFEHPDEILVKAFPGEPNTKLIEYKNVRSEKVRETLDGIDFSMEMGDGYYGVLASALYMVFSPGGQLVGFMDTALMSYTEDPEVPLVAAFVNPQGHRIGDIHQLFFFESYDEEAFKKDLPKELQP